MDLYFIPERIAQICKELNRQIYVHPLPSSACVVKQGFYKTPDQADAAAEPWADFGADGLWGGFDTHAWFRLTFRIPASHAGKALALRVSTGAAGWDATNPQFLLFIDGVPVQGMDVNHTLSTLPREYAPGDGITVDLQAYSGRVEGRHPLAAELVIVNTDVQALYYDLSSPLEVARTLPEGDLRRIDIVRALNDTINLLDLRKPFSEAYHASVRQALDHIRTAFYDRLRPGEVTAAAVGHTHIDVAWLWTLGQTREKTARSFATVLKLMDEYPEYIFMSSQPQLYKYLKEDHPDLYERVKERIKEGRWEADGAMWVEADCNLASGESFVRQILFGKRFFRKEFGVENCMLWLPDVFGYSAALPQILRKSGIRYFMTTKINWNEFNQIPYDTFSWQGIDGSSVLTHFITMRDKERTAGFFTTYNGKLEPANVMASWERYQQKDLDREILLSYGFGDGGGGTTPEMVEQARRMAKGIPGCPTVKSSTAADFFRGLEARVGGQKNLPRWVGELYLEFHRGTYTSMARNKRYNRKSEFALQDAETLSCLAARTGAAYPQAALNAAWETVLLNQFHDILPGSSIGEVYDESKIQYEGVLQAAGSAADGAMEAVAGQIALSEPGVVVFNTLGQERSDIVVFALPEGMQNPSVVDVSTGKVQDVQPLEGNRAAFYAESIPSKGYRAFALRERAVPGGKTVSAAADRMENDFFILDFDGNMEISRIYDKRCRREVLSPGARGNALLAYEDKPTNSDNWNIDIFYREKMWPVNAVVRAEAVESGPVRGVLRVERTFQDSKIIQDIILYRDIPRIDFDTYVDWKEDQVLLKAEFPVDIHAERAAYDIQFGNIERSTTHNTSWDIAAFEVCAHKWADLSEDGYGVSLLNDCKYGYDIKDGVMRLTLLKSGADPYPKADREEHRFVYSLYPHRDGWRTGGTVAAAYGLNIPLYARVESAHAGSLPALYSLFSVDCENVILETVKKAEDDGGVIVRLHECYNRRSGVTLACGGGILRAAECDLMEQEEADAAVQDGKLHFEIKPYEIKTFKLFLQ